MRGDELKHYPGEYAEIAYSIKELYTETGKFVASSQSGLFRLPKQVWPKIAFVIS